MGQWMESASDLRMEYLWDSELDNNWGEAWATWMV
jgi:hypothetical protein